MVSPARDISSHLEGVRNRAVVCSIPPSEVGLAIIALESVGIDFAVEADGEFGKGRK